jgi:hypothetical protein
MKPASFYSSIIQRLTGRSAASGAPPVNYDCRNRFMHELGVLAPPSGRGDYVFRDPSGDRLGFAQLTVTYSDAVTLHRIWTDRPGRGSGTAILRALCELADRNRIGIILKPLPFGQQPYPMSREQLVGWYRTHGFEGTHRRMARMPRQPQPVDKIEVIGS